MNITTVSPVFACGFPNFGPGIIALIIAWVAIIPLSVVNAILTAFKCKSENERTLHFVILAICAIVFANLYGVFAHGQDPQFVLASVLALPLVIYGQFFALLIRRRRANGSEMTFSNSNKICR